MWVVVTYDITDDRRRTGIFKILKSFGQHVQYSVFECDLTKQDLLRLRARLDGKVVSKDGDSIRFYHLCEACGAKIERLGGPAPIDKAIEFI